jgi:hypothetical protein
MSGTNVASRDMDAIYEGFKTRLMALKHWLQDAVDILEDTGGIRGSSIEDEKMFLIQDAITVFTASAFESYVKGICSLRVGPIPRNVNRYRDAKEMLKKAYGFDLGKLIQERQKGLDFLLIWRHVIVHRGNVPDDRFRRRYAELWGQEAAADWPTDRRVWLDPLKVENLMENVRLCVRLVHGKALSSI